MENQRLTNQPLHPHLNPLPEEGEADPAPAGAGEGLSVISNEPGALFFSLGAKSA
jgi:hypothetical protein